jgi:flagellar motor switch protein FliN/FliY
MATDEQATEETTHEAGETAEAAEAGTQVAEAQLPEAHPQPVEGEPGGIDILMDAGLTVEVQLGRAEASIRDLLALGPGAVLTLDKKAGEPVDLYLRGVRFATGQLVVVGDQLGVRIKEVVKPTTARAAAAGA